MVLLLLAVKSDDIIAISQHNFPFGYILAKAINPTGAIAICSLLIILLVIQVMAQLQASSRFVFALARDNAMPFAESIRWTNKYKQPIIANWVVIALCVPFCLLTIAGKGTLYSVLAVTAASLSFVGYVSDPRLLCVLFELTISLYRSSCTFYRVKISRRKEEAPGRSAVSGETCRSSSW